VLSGWSLHATMTLDDGNESFSGFSLRDPSIEENMKTASFRHRASSVPDRSKDVGFSRVINYKIDVITELDNGSLAAYHSKGNKACIVASNAVNWASNVI
jgi:hypothetical protein